MSDPKKLFWKNWIVLLLGMVMLLLPFLGFPARLNYWLFAIAGACIVVLSFWIGRGLSALYSLPHPEQVQPKKQPLRTPRSRAPRMKETMAPADETLVVAASVLREADQTESSQTPIVHEEEPSDVILPLQETSASEE